jgi:hypothetical protein
MARVYLNISLHLHGITLHRGSKEKLEKNDKLLGNFKLKNTQRTQNHLNSQYAERRKLLEYISCLVDAER